MRRLTRPFVGLLALAVVLWPGDAGAQYGAANGEWPTYAGDLGGTKYSPLDQIDASNFSDLEIAWRWESADGALDLDALRERHREIGIRNFKTTPLMVDGVVYVSTPLMLSAAIDAGTGEVLWVTTRRRICPTRIRTPASSATTRAGSPTGATATTRASCTVPTTGTCWQSTPGPANRSVASATTAGST